MYTSYFPFNAEPFQISTDPRFLWLGEQHKEALAILQFGIQENKGIIALSGGVGTGKTTLINALMSRLKGDVIAAVVSDPGLEPMEFFYYIANLFGIVEKENNKANFLLHFNSFLKKAHLQDKKVLLIIDEAQRLKSNLLEEVRLLSNIEYSGKRLLNVFLVGQNELNTMLLKPENRSLKQRIAAQFNVAPLTLDEVHAYIKHRLGVAGCEQRIFTDDAISEIFLFSKGYPRLINVICDHSLISAFVKNSRKVSADMVAGSVKEFQFQYQTPSKPPNHGEDVHTKTAKMSALPPVPFNHHKEKQNRSKDKNMLSSLQFAYIGLLLVFLVSSGYFIYQYSMGFTPSDPELVKGDGRKHRFADKGEESPLQNVRHRLSPSSDVKALLPPDKIDEDKTEIKEATAQPKNGQSSASAKKSVAWNTVVDTPYSNKAEGELNAPADAPATNGAGTKEKFSGGNEAVLPASHTFAKDKDPGAIIEWLIQTKSNNFRE